MSDKRIIIRNCPCYWHIGEDDGCSLENMKDCEDDTDCVMKQIVELCKENLNSLETYIDVRSLECTILQRILKLLDIKEVE